MGTALRAPSCPDPVPCLSLVATAPAAGGGHPLSNLLCLDYLFIFNTSSIDSIFLSPSQTGGSHGGESKNTPQKIQYLKKKKSKPIVFPNIL